MKEKKGNKDVNVSDMCQNNEYYYSLSLMGCDRQILCYTYDSKGKAIVEFFKFAKFESFEYIILFKCYNDPRIEPEKIMHLQRY